MNGSSEELLSSVGGARVEEGTGRGEGGVDFAGVYWIASVGLETLIEGYGVGTEETIYTAIYDVEVSSGHAGEGVFEAGGAATTTTASTLMELVVVFVFFMIITLFVIVVVVIIFVVLVVATFMIDEGSRKEVIAESCVGL